jgi:hypothetical protein
MDFTAYMALPQVDRASGEDHPPEMEEDWVHVGHEADVQEAGIDPEGRKETITASISASLTPGNVATTRGKRMNWPVGSTSASELCMSLSTHPEKTKRHNTERHNTSDSDNTSDTSTSNLPRISACLRLLQGMEHGPRGTKKASGFQGHLP